MKTQNFQICEDNIIRKRVGKKWNPTVPNSIFQPLLEKLQKDGKLAPRDENLYGQCILTLVEIVLNNVHFKYQREEVKDDCRGAALENLIVNLPKYFKPAKGSTAYSYAFRCAYTAMIKVLEGWNDRDKHEITVTNLIIEKEREEE